MYALKAAKNLQRCVQVEWEDGMLAKFSHVWLRDNTLRRPSLVHLDLNTKPEGIKCRKDALEVRWPPFLASSYTSTFLRDNALYTPTPIDKKVASTSASSNNYGGAAVEDPLGGNLLALVDARFPVDEQCVMGKCFWGEPAQEPGTIWPHLDRVPPFCTVDTLNGEAKLCFVETQKALDQLRECHPREFNFLANCVLEYREGPFAATHPIIRTDNQGAVFNNATRSCAITVESLDDLYRSMQKFGRICAENMQELQLLPGQRLLFNNHRGMLGVPAQSGRSLMLRCLSSNP